MLNPLHPRLIPLRAATATHPWGPPSSSSLCSRLHLHNQGVAVSGVRYAHFIITTLGQLHTVLATSPEVALHTHIEEQVIEVEASYVDFYTHLHQHGLPYQLAILSVATPQPLCVHPAAPMAARLADEFSFQRAVPKSVMLVALRHGHVLFGIREAPDIVAELSRVPEFADAVGRPEIDAFVHVVKTQAATSRHVRDIISNLLQQPVPFVTNCLNRAVKRLLKMPKDMVTESDRLFISLSESFHNDPMCFAVYFLNRIKMKPGEAILISPEDPYCVLEGEFIEASSCSDATVIGGLSKENIHTDLFLEALSFNSSPVEVSSGERFSEYGVLYVPPVPEFHLLVFTLPSGISQQMLETVAPSIILVVEGEGVICIEGEDSLLPLRVGSVYYLIPQTSFFVKASNATKSALRVIQIGVNETALPSASSCALM